VLDLSEAVVVDFPLRGEWVAINTPAHRVPSHGTDYFGQRYAFDFVQMNAKGAFSPHSLGRQLAVGLPAPAFHCWDQPIHSAFAGTVITAADGWPDRRYVHGLWELVRATFIAPFLSTPRDSDYRPLAGNHVLVAGEPGVGFFAHLRMASLRVGVGERVTTASVIGAVGNSGNTTMPHLHFHVMDQADPLRARGVFCAFRSYERFIDGRWDRVERGIPQHMERVRAA
jgi:Peptidase family M23